MCIVDTENGVYIAGDGLCSMPIWERQLDKQSAIDRSAPNSVECEAISQWANLLVNRYHCHHHSSCH